MICDLYGAELGEYNGGEWERQGTELYEEDELSILTYFKGAESFVRS